MQTSTKTMADSEPPRRKRRSSEDLMNRILDAAAQEFKRVGYAGATTAAIARRAEVTEAQLFRYFRSKSDLFREAIFKPLDEQLLNFTDAHLPEPGNLASFREMAALYTEELQRFVGENVDMITSLVAAQLYEPDSAHGVGAIGSLGKYFERGASIMRRRVREPAKVAPELMVRVSFAAVLACIMFKDWMFPPGLASDEEIRNAIDDFVLDGINANAESGRANAESG
jgi:AcrR family transcriptional regulator